MNAKLRSIAAMNGCTETIAVEQPCDCGAALPDGQHHIPIIITFGGASYAACYDVDDSTNPITKKLCIPATVPIGKGGTYTIVYTSPLDGSTVTETGSILNGGGESALCQKTEVVTPKPVTID